MIKKHCPGCDKRTDIRGFLTTISVLLVFGLAFAQMILGYEEGATIPPWAAAYLVSSTQLYFMGKNNERHAEALRKKIEE